MTRTSRGDRRCEAVGEKQLDGTRGNRKEQLLEPVTRVGFPGSSGHSYSGEAEGRGVTVGLACVPSPVTASLMRPVSPLAVHVPQDIGPDVGPLAQTQSVGRAGKGMPRAPHRVDHPYSQGGCGG